MAGTRDWIAGGQKAELAGSKWQEGIACETRGAGSPGVFQLIALVGCEESEGGVSFTCYVSNEERLDG